MRKLLITLLQFALLPAFAGVQSETIFFVQPDGRNYLLERSIHSDSPTHRFHLNKRIQLDDIRHISPARFEWDDSEEQVNSLIFEAGGFTIIYPDRFNDNELKQDKDGVFHYESWDGRRDASGRYGYWYAPGQFDQFTYTWILPNNITLLRYRSNLDGRWTKRNNAISFYAEKVNNLTFEMSYRVLSQNAGSASLQAKPKTTKRPVIPAAVSASAERRRPPRTGWPGRDADNDAVSDADDLCPDTPQGALADEVGCPLDTDRDGVADGVDQCIATPEETAVDSFGCTQ